ncbi:cornifelin -like protein [Brachionus plicatilis]|uniref:Cornifelin-like protein n=1 Tax=Brachionus plicatilis TaxID=10195 RepID=A0A3M7QFE8_BRAPC|nr:cornifelin -like protein [Brachionus plicatilis]
MIIGEQPTRDVWDFENEWTEGLCGCCHNTNECCYAYFCCPCFTCRLYERAGESCCTPLCIPTSLVILRGKIRTAFRINGSICEDCLASSACPCCTAIQISNELYQQGI